MINKITIKTKHFPEITLIKGIGIFLVVLGHLKLNSPELTKVIFNFHMPLFFFVSGFLFRAEATKLFLKKKFKRILIPYLFFSTLSFILYYIPHYKDSLISVRIFFEGTLLGISDDYYLSWNTVLWFLPCLFVLNLIYNIIAFLPVDTLWKNVIKIIFWFCGLCFSNNPDTILPFHVLSAFLMIPFFETGRLVRIYYAKIYEGLSTNSFVVGLLAVTFGISLSLLNYISPDIRINMTGNALVFYPSALLTIIGLLFLCRYFEGVRVLRWLGDHSLEIMGFHLKFVGLATFIFYKIGLDTIGIFPSCLLVCLIIILLWPLIYIINRFTPYFVGK